MSEYIHLKKVKQSIKKDVQAIFKVKVKESSESMLKCQNETIEYIQMNQIKVMNSGIRVN